MEINLGAGLPGELFLIAATRDRDCAENPFAQPTARQEAEPGDAEDGGDQRRLAPPRCGADWRRGISGPLSTLQRRSLVL